MSSETPPAANHAQFSALADGVTLMRASFADHAFGRHSHDCFAIGVTTYSIQSFRCKGRRYSSRAGDFVLFNPDEDHDGNRGDAEGFRYTIWYVPNAFVDACVDQGAGLAGIPYFAAPQVSDRRITVADLATVAVECGFADHSHLTRRFKGSVGASPSDWRKMTAPSPVL